jgi:hypothetical protein
MSFMIVLLDVVALRSPDRENGDANEKVRPEGRSRWSNGEDLLCASAL